MTPQLDQSIRRPRRRVRSWQVVAAWFVFMSPMAFWGLPTAKYDPYLFPDGNAWTAEQYAAARSVAQRGEHTGGADTDLDPIADRDKLVELTADDAGVAAILLRYRLYSRQPDEMITFMSLREMHPSAGQFDPRLYQYGGGYIYLIGAAIGAASVAGFMHITSDVGVYLTDPVQFARFYIVARFVSLLFGALLLVAVIRLARMAAGRTAGWIAFVLVAASPVFLSGVLDAKPHIPSACMLLWAMLSGLRFARDGRLKHALNMGWQGGYAFALVLTGVAAALIWPAVAFVRMRGRVRAVLLAGVLAISVYAFTNPYVVKHLLIDRGGLSSNVDNSTAMYRVGIDRMIPGAIRVGQLLYESAGVVPVFAILALIVCAGRWGRRMLVPALPGGALLLLAIVLGQDKPAEFARFLIVPCILLCVASAVLLAVLSRRSPAVALMLAIVLLLSMRTANYVESFVHDSGLRSETRFEAAAFLHDALQPQDAVAVVQEPAPYSIPPLDFARRRVVLLPENEPSPPLATETLPKWLVLTADDASVFAGAWWLRDYALERRFPADDRHLSRITWADKPVFVFRHR